MEVLLPLVEKYASIIARVENFFNGLKFMVPPIRGRGVATPTGIL